MKDISTESLNELTCAFYNKCADSFSQTRASAWQGWQQVTSALAPRVSEAMRARGAVRVLDLACGNLRFERFLGEQFPEARFDVLAVDVCEQLARPALPQFENTNVEVNFLEADILHDINAKAPYGESFDLAVAFGFMHHVPTADQRERLLLQMLQALRAGGTAVVSFWQFAKSARLMEKARKATERAQQEHGILVQGENDYLMGWQNDAEALRFCHNFEEAEVDGLVRSACEGERAMELARFSADGESANLNRYVVLEKKGAPGDD